MGRCAQNPVSQSRFFSAFSFSILNPLPTLFVLIWSGYGLLHYGSFDFIAWVAVLLLGSGMAEAVMPMMMLNNPSRKRV